MDVGLQHVVHYAEQVGKPIICTEACWGSLDDEARARCIEGTLSLLNKYEIGWIVYALWTSGIADLHGPEMGTVGSPGNLAFVMADGSLRTHHDVINHFVKRP